MANRADSFESVLARVKVKRTVVSAATCVAVDEALESLGKLPVSVPERNVVVIHPTVYRFVLDMGGGSMDLSLYEPEQALVRWAKRTFDELQRCAPRK